MLNWIQRRAAAGSTATESVAVGDSKAAFHAARSQGVSSPAADGSGAEGNLSSATQETEKDSLQRSRKRRKKRSRKAAYHGAEVGAGGEPEPGAAKDVAPEGRPESRNEMEALSRRHGDGGREGQTMNRMRRSQRPSGGGRSHREAARKLG